MTQHASHAAVPYPPGIVLKRRRSERILLGDGTVIEIVDARGGYSHVRIWAPSGVGIWREEIAPEHLAAVTHFLRLTYRA